MQGREPAVPTRRPASYLDQHVVAVPVESVLLPVEGGDVGAALQGAGAWAWQVFAHPAAGGADAVGHGAQGQAQLPPPAHRPLAQGSQPRAPSPGNPPQPRALSPPAPSPRPPAHQLPARDPPLLAVIGDLLAGQVQVPVDLAVTLADGNAASARNVIVHSAWTVGKRRYPRPASENPRIPTAGLSPAGPQPRAGL